MIAFYISGHGFGHASRQIEIINALAARRPDLGIFIRSSAARRLFDRTVIGRFDLDSRPCDTGVVQIDSLRLDAAATVARAAEFHRALDARAAEEAVWLRERGVRLVISDAPPLAYAAALAAGIPSVVVSNFTWDWIYAEYAEHLSSAPELIPTIQAAYRHAAAAWRLPMHGGFGAFSTIADAPFVARHATHGRKDTRRRLGLPQGARIALSSFGGYSVDGIRFDDLDTAGAWDVVVTRSAGNERVPAGVRALDESAIYAAGVRYEDLVAACDVVVTKPGYGIISECIANDTALVYTSRGRFAEYPVLVREMPRYLRCAFIERNALMAGRWRAALDEALNAPPPPERPATNGAELIAEKISGTVNP